LRKKFDHVIRVIELTNQIKTTVMHELCSFSTTAEGVEDFELQDFFPGKLCPKNSSKRERIDSTL